MFKLMEFLRYSPERSFDLFDDVSFQDYADSIGLPPMMRRVFISFTRAFFADPDKISYAELLKSFHFFYLSHDFGIDYDTSPGTVSASSPDGRGIPEKARGGNPSRVYGRKSRRTKDRTARRRQGLRLFILAADPKGARRIAEASPAFAGDPEWREKIVRLKSAQGYAVYKIWTDRPLLGEYPPFFITDRFEVLDAFTQFHLFDPEAAAWAASNGGAVYELHCYAVPERYFGNDEKIKALFMEEAVRFFPELKAAALLRESFHMNDDFHRISQRIARRAAEHAEG
jgi:isorenieratene synthase